jgi:hypothetical protein
MCSKTAYAAAEARFNGLQTMLSRLQEAGVRVPMEVLNAVALPLLHSANAERQAIVDAASNDFTARIESQRAALAQQNQ